MTSFSCPFRVHDKPYVELKDSDGRSDLIVAEEVGLVHSSLLLKQLHCPPVVYRIKLKLATVKYCTISTQ